RGAPRMGRRSAGACSRRRARRDKRMLQQVGQRRRAAPPDPARCASKAQMGGWWPWRIPWKRRRAWLSGRGLCGIVRAWERATMTQPHSPCHGAAGTLHVTLDGLWERWPLFRATWVAIANFDGLHVRPYSLIMTALLRTALGE